MHPIVRPTGILIENGKILLIKQKLKEQQNWSLPGGALEYGETIEQCLIREMKEEVGVEVRINDLLYICDRFRSLKHHIVDISFLVERTPDSIELKTFSDEDEEVLCKIEMVPIGDIKNYGFSEKFSVLIKSDFPERGSYQGDFHNFYG